MQFANAVVVSHSGIGEKVCETKNGYSRGKSFGVYADSTGAKTGNGNTSLCGDSGRTDGDSTNTPQALKEFVANTLKDGSQNWPKSSGTGTPTPKPNDNAEAVAKDLVEKLTSEEKTIVAGLLAKTIEGGEVVEIRAVSSTSVMVNAEFEIIRLFRRESEF
ncbi:hypothetical protein ANAPC1_00654 [Anaplasma phagocytophilum]|uniref:Uncharacterized protein n=1 Tax=Anaplasma phagocytophilum TaxID=948 RepID=A0AA45ZHH4_ANAPH|nr:hypothetical protein ANAPC1_00654 [Anaplasma phagocytophilum]